MCVEGRWASATAHGHGQRSISVSCIPAGPCITEFCTSEDEAKTQRRCGCGDSWTHGNTPHPGRQAGTSPPHSKPLLAAYLFANSWRRQHDSMPECSAYRGLCVHVLLMTRRTAGALAISLCAYLHNMRAHVTVIDMYSGVPSLDLLSRVCKWTAVDGHKYTSQSYMPQQ